MWNQEGEPEGWQGRRLTLAAVLVATTVAILGIIALAGGHLTEPASNLLVALVWPIALVSLALVFGKETREFLKVAKKRVEGGSGFTLGPFALTAETENIPVPSKSQQVTIRNAALLHTSFFSEKGTRKINDGRVYYQIEIVVIAPKPVMERIEQVTYTLPDAWPEQNRVNVVRDRQSRFKMKELANGTAIVLAEIRFIDQEEPVWLNRFIDLRPDGPRI